LSRVEESEECHATVLSHIDEVPNIERDVLQPQPADTHRAVPRELHACLGELSEEILGGVDLVPQPLES